MTTNCIVPVLDSYRDRIFTTGVVGFPGVPHVADRKNVRPKDFTAVIERAKRCAPPAEIETGTQNGGFARACRLVNGMDEADFRKTCECLKAQELHILNKESFMFEEDPSDRIGVVTMGNVRLTRRRLDGGRNVLENVSQCDVFGTTYAFRDVETMGIGATSVGESVVLLLNTKNITASSSNVGKTE